MKHSGARKEFADQRTAKGARGMGPRQKTSKIIKEREDKCQHFFGNFVQAKEVKK